MEPEKEENENVGLRLKAVRNNLKMTQREFSDLIGISQSSYSLMETGRISVANRYLKSISILLGVNETWLETGEGEMFENDPEPGFGKLFAIYRCLPPSLKTGLESVASTFAKLADSPSQSH